MKRSSLSVVAWGLLALGVFVAALVCISRARVEHSTNRVSVVVPWEDVELLHAATHKPYAELLRQLSEAGATAIGVREDTPAILVTAGMMRIEADESGTILIASDAEIAGRAARFLEAKMPGRTRLRGTRVALDGVVFDERLANSGVGLAPWICRRIRAAGMGILARPQNDPLHNRDSLALLLTQLSSLGAWALVPEGAEVLGYDNLVQAVAKALKKAGIVSCSIEFASQFGDQALAKALDGGVIRLHSITTAEMEKLGPEEARDRFLRAVRERNVRVCYVRLLARPAPDFVSRNLGYLGTIRSGLEGAGYQLGTATTFPDRGVSLGLTVLISLAVWAALVLLLSATGATGWRLALLLGLAGWVLGATALAASPLLGRKLLALIAAVLFPTLAIAQVVQSDALRRRPAGPALGLAAASGLSVCGGLVIGALLFSRTFLTKADAFSGVKLALIAPVLLLFLWLIVREALLTPQDHWAEASREWRLFVEQPLRAKHLLIGLAVALVAVVWLLRSGNVPETTTFPFERQLRTVMEQVFGSRPRTKEFLFGHPLLLIGLWLWARAAQDNRVGTVGAAKALILLGAVGQVSIVNSFCHLHSPIGLTLLRIIHGLWLGALVGAIIVAIVQGALVRLRKEPLPRQPGVR